MVRGERNEWSQCQYDCVYGVEGQSSLQEVVVDLNTSGPAKESDKALSIERKAQWSQ